MAYLYAAIGFSILIEMFNQISRWRRKKNLQGERTIRERTAHAVLRLMGGRHVGADEVGEEISDMLGEQSVDAVFGRRERVMISGVLQLAERPVRTVMTVRTDIDHIDLGDSYDEVRQALMNSAHSRLVVIRDGQIDEPLGYVHKKELFKELLTGNRPNPENLVRASLNLPETCLKNA